MEQQQFHLHELLFLEDHHLQFQRSFEDAIIPSYDNNLFDFSTNNYLLQYPTFSSSFENLDLSDFQSWNECPPLSDEDTTNNAWQPISQPPPSPSPLPCINDNTSNNNNKPFSFDHQFLLPNTSFDDQTLAVVVAEGYTMPKKGNKVIKVEDSVVSEDEEIMMRIKGDDYDNNDDYLKVKKIESIDFEEIKKYFDKPIQKAAKELNVGLTVLKKRCRELNIKRWPHRKIKSLEALIRNVKELGMVEMVEVLEEHKKNLQTMPGLELTKETKKLRQSCFKANYKKRRALNLSQIN